MGQKLTLIRVNAFVPKFSFSPVEKFISTRARVDLPVSEKSELKSKLKPELKPECKPERLPALLILTNFICFGFCFSFYFGFSTPLLAEEHLSMASLPSYMNLTLEEVLNVEIQVASPKDEGVSELLTPSSATVISERKWLQLGSRNLMEVLSNQAGIDTFTTLGGGGVSIRGYTDPTHPTRGVALILDGVPLNVYVLGTAFYQNSEWPLATLSKVEVLKGSASDIYGADAFHGVVSMKSWDPEEDRSEFKSSLGTDKNYNFSLRNKSNFSNGFSTTINFSFDEQKPLGILNEFEDTDARTGLFSAYENEFDYENRARTAIVKTHFKNNMLGFYYTRGEGDNWPSSQLHVRPGALLNRDTETKLTQYLHTNELGDYGLSWRSFWMEIDNPRFNERASDYPYSDIMLWNGTKDRRWGSVLKLSSPVLKFNDHAQMFYTTGLEYTKQRAEAGYYGSDPAAPEEDGLENGAKFYAASVFFNSTLSTGPYQFTAGFRYDDYRPFPNHFSPKLGAILKATERSSFKLLWSNGFRTPEAKALRGSPSSNPNPDIKPETLETLELVYLNIGDQSRFQATVFNSQWDDAIILQPIETVGRQYLNSGSNTAEGLEVEFEYLYDTWVFSSSASYITSENEDTNIEYGAFAEEIVNWGLSYHASDRLSYHWQNRHQFNMDNIPAAGENDPNLKQLPHYWRSNVVLLYRNKRDIDFNASIKNLFDRENIRPSIWRNPNGLTEDGIALFLGAKFTW